MQREEEIAGKMDESEGTQKRIKENMEKKERGRGVEKESKREKKKKEKRHLSYFIHKNNDFIK